MIGKKNAINMKIVITGPESSGKSTLFKALEKHYKVIGAGEYARDFLTTSNGEYIAGDLLTISKGQIEKELYVKALSKSFVLCDTDLLTIKIWSEYKFNFCDTQILNLLSDYPADFYLLMSPDIPWEPDPLRENPDDRLDILAIHIKELRAMGIPYVLISGALEQRFQQSINLINKLLLIN